MSKVRFQIAISLDGYMAGPEQSETDPLGIGGMDLHQWMFDLEAWRQGMGQEGGAVNASTLVIEEASTNLGAQRRGDESGGTAQLIAFASCASIAPWPSHQKTQRCGL